MSLDELKLRDVPLFRGLSSRLLEALEGIGMRRRLEKGQMLFSQGDLAKGFYVLVSGKVKVMKLSFQGKTQILGVLGPGDTVGEVPVFEGVTYPAYAQTMENSTLLFFPRDRFIALIKENPDLALGMMALLSRRLRKITTLAGSLALREVPGRLAQHRTSSFSNGRQDVAEHLRGADSTQPPGG